MSKQEKVVNIAFNSAESIRDICKPLFDIFGLNYFDFFRAYNDGSRVYLCSSVDWLEYEFQQTYWHTNNFAIAIPDNINHLTWSDITHYMPQSEQVLFQDKHKDAYNHFDFCNGVALIDRGMDYVDFYNFGAGRDNQLIYEIYLREIDILKRFILYFREAANPIILQVIANRARQTENGQNAVIVEQNNTELDIKKNLFLSKTPLKRLYFADLQTYLTVQEANCLKLLSSGLSVKQIARQLGISPRSAETYIGNIKIKLNCSRQSELTAIARDFRFFDAY